MLHVSNHLQVGIQTQNCQVPEDVRSRIQPVIEQLDATLQEFPDCDLWLNVVFHEKSAAYQAQAKLRLPGETINTTARDQYIDNAILRCLEKAERRANHYRSKVDNGVLRQAHRESELEDGVVVPTTNDAGQIGQAVANDDYLGFRLALLGHEEPLRKRIGRWIQRYPKVQDRIDDSFEIADFVEEVFLLAFEKYTQRPEELSISEWLTSLIDPAVKAYWYDAEDRQAASYARTLFEQHIGQR